MTWSVSLRSCLERRGFDVGEPRPMRTRIELSVAGAPSRRGLLRSTITCGDNLGGPPEKTSLQTLPSKLVLYLPKQCLLDPNITTSAVP